MSAFAWAILAAICWGVAPLIEKWGLQGKIDPVVGVFIRSLGVLVGLLGLLVYLPRVSETLRELPTRSIVYLLGGGLLASILGQLFFYRALKTGEVSRVVAIAASYPVLAFILGVLILKEPLTTGKVTGIALVMSGIYLLR